MQKKFLKEVSPVHIEDSLFTELDKESIYYKAILQNLFFATLNCPIKPNSIDKRKRGFSNGNFGVTYLMRYEKYFKDPEAFIQIVNETVPFLNGGLFECLDIRGEGETKDKRIYIDGFSDNLPKEHQLIVPDYLFFGMEEKIDLTAEFGIKNKKTKEASVMGLINILKEYNFTIDENEPNDIEVALDPELLGKVFENLLASYNPETKTTARKQTGSFYTPREIVNYMVDESLIAHLKNSLQSNKSFQLLNLKKQESLAIQNSKQNLKQDASDTFLNPNDEIIIKKGKLPHWSQKNSWYFVTFRLADSIPKEKIELLKNEREIWLKKHSNKDKKGLTKEELKEYYSLFSQRVENWLNAGYGSCIFKDEKYAKIVGNALLYFNNKRYELDEWVVMPNHVHILFKPLNNYKIEDICHSWKSYTANKINKLLGRRGQLWMHESYDHIVRNEKAFMAIKKYIQENPEKANIVSKASSFSEKVSNASSFSSNAPCFSEKSKQIPKQDALDTLLHQLVSLSSVNPFEDNEELSKEILHSLNNCKILDPACGSGAFPMGILQKMVHILRKVDPENKYWQEIQMEKAIKETESAFKIKDKKEREQFLLEINEAFDQTVNSPDYARKLFLIENCIYGVDIQPIATQISKLRFFISLVVEQKVNKEKPNFGIRPLPNLETKFITANTLIGIEKPKLELDFFDSENIKKLEKELKFIRHKLFGAKTKKTKLKYRTRDKELREQIAEELQENGWGNEAAQQLAKWDPYDQNGVSPFFDPEWMFDIKDGFDIVIGNPPYGAKLSKEIVKKYKEFFELKTSETAILFIEKGKNLLTKSGTLTYIVPKALTYSSNYKKTRDFIQDNLYQIVDCGKAFEQVKLEATVFSLINNLTSNSYLSFKYDSQKRFLLQARIDKKLIDEFDLLLNGVETNEISIAKIIKSNLSLNSVAHNSRGAILQKHISSTGDYRIIGGKEIDRKGIKGVKGFIRAEYCNSSKCKIDKNSVLVQRIVAHLTKPTEHIKITACIPQKRDFIITDTINQITLINNEISLELICTLLNSKVINWYAYRFIYGKAIRTMQFDNPVTNRIPIVLPENLVLFTIMHFALLLQNKDFFGKLIDAIIFNLYFPDHMKEREIDILQFVEKDIEEVMQNRDFETLNDAEKEKIINELHTRWSDPNNEIVKRMSQFKEKSPDILKVILES